MSMGLGCRCICSALLLFLLTGCYDSNEIYQKSIDLPETGWAREGILKDAWTTSESVESAPALLSIVHAADFGYQNIYLTGRFYKNNQVLWTDTFSVQLVRPQGGGWLGQKQGDELIMHDTLPFRLSMQEGDVFSWELGQYSREEDLGGVSEVRVQVLEPHQIKY